MVDIFFLFGLLIFMFALIGAMRGWAKELLVVFSIILALFMITLLESFVIRDASKLTGKGLFWLRTLVLAALAFFGYQTALLRKFVNMDKLAREHFQDLLLGIVIGAINGFLIVGSIWYYMHQAGYPFPNFIKMPTDPVAAARVTALMNFMPPRFLGTPGIYFAVGLAFLFVIVVFI